MTPHLPITVIGGFLGAGKTTLVNSLLRHANGLRIAVLVNEFGALPIDEDLIEAEGDDLIAIAGGCVCCAFGDNLAAALTHVADLEPRPDHVVLEASGVALPGGIAANVSLLTQYDLNAIVVLTDAETVQTQAADRYLGDTIPRQIQDADLLLMTKSDPITQEACDRALTWIGLIAPEARACLCPQGQLPLSVVLGFAALTRETAADTHRDRWFDSCVTTPADRTNVRALASALTSGRFGVLCAKGTPTDNQGANVSLQIVGARWSVQPSQSPPRTQDSSVSALPTHLDAPGIAAAFEAHRCPQEGEGHARLSSQGSASVS